GSGANGGTGDPGLASPSGMRIGPDGKLYIVDLLIGTVRRFIEATGAFDTNFIAPGGQLANQFPSDLVFDRQGQLLVADLGSDFSTPSGNVKAFNATTGAFTSNYASGVFGASQLELSPVPEPTTWALCGTAAAGF